MDELRVQTRSENCWRNFRDVADLQAVRSHAVRRGMLYRSAAFSHLPERLAKDWLRAKGIRRILDLRMAEEFVDTECDPADICERLHVPLFETVPLEWSHPIDRTPEAIATRYVAMAETGGTALVGIAETLAVGGNIPTLLHCVAGRDRTGIVAAAEQVLGFRLPADLRELLSEFNGIWYTTADGRKHGYGEFASLDTQHMSAELFGRTRRQRRRDPKSH